MLKHLMHSIPGFLGVLLLVTLLGCTKHKKPPSDHEPKRPSAFKESIIDEITPVLGGGAYAGGYADGIWFLYKGESARVKITENATLDEKKAFEEMGGSTEITPVLAGGAYAHTFSGETCWYLEGTTAYPVTQVESITLPPPTAIAGTGRELILYQNERKKRKEAQSESEDLRSQIASEEAEEPSDDSP